MGKTKAMPAKAKTGKRSFEKLKVPQLKALHYLLSAITYVSLLEGSAKRKKYQKDHLEL